LGKKTLEAELLKEALELTRSAPRIRTEEEPQCRDGEIAGPDRRQARLESAIYYKSDLTNSDLERVLSRTWLSPCHERHVFGDSLVER